jgi:hemerythrin superfamily protein
MENEPRDQETQWQASTSPTDMLRADHRKVEELFEAFESAAEGEKKQIVTKVIRELKIHATIEEEIFYPAMRREDAEGEMVDEALEEHHVVKLLISELEGMTPGDEHYDAKFKVLAENVKHHVQEEESEMFPKAESSEIRDLSEEMLERKRELEAEFSGEGSGGRRTKTRRSAGSGRTSSRAKSKKR